MAEGATIEWWNNQTPDYPGLKRKDRPSWNFLGDMGKKWNAGEAWRGHVWRGHVEHPDSSPPLRVPSAKNSA